MKLNLYNTANKQITQFAPITQGKVGIYACGPTVYDFAHIGHLRKFTMDDVLIRTLKYENKALGIDSYTVKFVRNITDVGHLTSDGDTGEDKLEKGSKKYGQTVWDIAKKFTDHFHKSMQLMGTLEPDVTGVVTDHIQEQLDLVTTLEKKGYTYIIENDGVYFDTSKFPEYGKMAGLNLEEQEEGARIGVVAGKRNPADFALWKFEREGENRQMSWKSPWAEKSFPGWHIECSAIGMKYLGEQFDIHTGGIDHIPVHHTNEIAQSEAATGKSPFVKYWVHHNFLKVAGEKMSKSLGNFYTVDDILERGYHPLALRLLFLTAHYRSEMNFTWENLAGSQKAYVKLIRSVKYLCDFIAEKGEKTKQADADLVKKYAETFFESIATDLNTAGAISVMWNVVNDTSLSATSKRNLLLEFTKILGLGFEKPNEVWKEITQHVETFEISAEVKDLLAQRKQARETKDFSKSDEIRDKLLEMGYKILDVPEGQKVEKV